MWVPTEEVVFAPPTVCAPKPQKILNRERFVVSQIIFQERGPLPGNWGRITLAELRLLSEPPSTFLLSNSTLPPRVSTCDFWIINRQPDGPTSPELFPPHPFRDLKLQVTVNASDGGVVFDLKQLPQGQENPWEHPIKEFFERGNRYRADLLGMLVRISAQSLETVYAEVLGPLVSKPANSSLGDQGDLRGFLDKLDRGESDMPGQRSQLDSLREALKHVDSAAKYLAACSGRMNTTTEFLSSAGMANISDVAAARRQISLVLENLSSIQQKAQTALKTVEAKLEDLDRGDAASRDHLNIALAGAGFALSTLPYFQGLFASFFPEKIVSYTQMAAGLLFCGTLLFSVIRSARARRS